MDSPLAIDYENQTYCWNGKNWYRSDDYTRPPLGIVPMLNNLRIRQMPPPVAVATGDAIPEIQGRPFRILITGARTWNDIAPIRRELERFPAGSVLIHGDAEGVDRLAGQVGSERGFQIIACPPDLDKHGKNAGPIRNKSMLTEHLPDVVIAFHAVLEKASGTRHMVTIARKAGVPVRVVSA
jgi:YspA, cpYpsA-related SLOG family